MPFKHSYRGILVLALFFFAFFHRILFYDEVFYCCDNLLINIPSKIFLMEELRHGIFPLWNPFLLSGTPFFADINVSALHPLNLAYFILPPFRALTTNVLILIFSGSLGAFFLARKLHLSNMAAVATATIFTFSGSVISATNNIPILQVIVLVPWIMYLWTQYVETGSFKFFLWLAGILTLQIFSGHIQFVYYSWLLGIAYYLTVSSLSWRIKFQNIFLLLILVASLSAIQTIPFLEMAQNSTRAGAGLDYSVTGSLHPFNIVRLLFARIVGSWSEGTAWVQGGAVDGYIGFLPLLLLFFLPIKRKIVKFFLVVSAVSFLLAFGKYTPLYGLFYTFVPGFGLFREPRQLLFIYSFGLSVLAGFAIDELSLPRRVNKYIRLLLIFSFSLLVIGGLFWLFHDQILSLLSHIGFYFPAKLQNKIQGLSYSNKSLILTLIQSNFLIQGAFLAMLASAWSVKKIKITVKQFLLVIVIFCDLLIFSSQNLLTIPIREVNAWFSASRVFVDQLDDFDWKKDRILVDPREYPAPRIKKLGYFNEHEESQWQAYILRNSFNMIYRVPSVDGYASMIYKPYQNFFDQKPNDPTGVNLGTVPNINIDLAGAKYISVNPRDSRVFHQSKLTLFKQESLKSTYKNLNASPRFFLTKEMSGDAITINEYTSNIVRVTVSSGESNVLVFTDVNYPGWSAFIDKRKAPIYSYNNIFKSVQIPRGKHTVEFVFSPVTHRIGYVITIVGSVVYFGLIANEMLKNRRLVSH